jgi:hypothetical protein
VTKLLSFQLSVAFAAVVGVLLMFVPLLSVHGVESALALGLLLPPWVAATGASYAARHPEGRGVDLMSRSIGAGLLIWAIPSALLALNALRVRQCAPGEGLAFMLLGPGLGCVLAGAVGVWMAGLLRRPQLAAGVAAVIPVASALFGLWTFYATPTVYVFSAFAGYFPGAIYDDLVRIPDRYLTYRASIVILVLALTILFEALWDPTASHLDLRGHGRSRLGMLIVGAGALGVVLVTYWNGAHLGHWVSEAYVVERLGKTARGRHCLIHLPRETRAEDAQQLLDDCDFHFERARLLSGVAAKEPITAYFFRNESEKKGLIGVGRTLIAKPWRREVYLQMTRWPNGSLGHEVVHAVLSEAGRSPFAVAARLGGLIPNPGLIEGAAVAIAWDIRDDLDPDQWSRIMLDREELPAADALMSVRFSSMPARHAYMAAGSLMRFLIAKRGTGFFLEAYHRGHIDGLAELETEWRAYLEGVPVTPHERGVAEVALARPSIFKAVCPHELAKLRVDLSGDAAARDDVRMLETCEAILDIDEHEAHARAAMVGALARTGKREEALKQLDVLRAAMTAPKPLVANALEAFADASWTQEDYDEAAGLYDELLSLPRTDGRARQSEVKRLALASDSAQREMFYQMFVRGVSSPVAVHLAHSIGALREDGLGPYLEGRQLWAQRQYALALPLFEEAMRLGLPTARLMRELDRLTGITAFALGRYDESAAAWRSRALASRAAEAEARLWLERIEYARTGSFTPRLGPSSAPQAVP